MNTITVRRFAEAPERLVMLPLDVPKAAAVLRKAFSESELRELIRLLHWSSVLEEPEEESR